MRTPILLACALLLPSVADARPTVWFHADRKDAPEPDEYREEVAMVAEVKVEVERRAEAIEARRIDRSHAREVRRQARKDARMARKDLRYATRNDTGIDLATDALMAAERQLAETHDYVDLQQARVDSAKEHHTLAKTRLSRAIAARELAEALLVPVDYGDDTYGVPTRFTRQLDRMQEKVHEQRADWKVAQSYVREASQDHWSYDDPTVFASFYRVPTVDTLVVTDDAPELRRLHFELGEHHVRTEDKQDLVHNAAILRDHRNVEIRIEGHTDATGMDAANLDLAWDRAEAVAAKLRQLGVWDSQIQTVAFGEGSPMVNTTESTAFNRRVELRVIEPDNDAIVEGTVEGMEGYGNEPAALAY